MHVNGSYPVWEAYFDSLLAGKISNWWTRQDLPRRPKLLKRSRFTDRIGYRLAKTQYQWQVLRSNRYSIKEIRANLMLDWLARYTSAKIVFLIRHPCEVIGSQMSQEEQAWVADIEEILCQPSLMSDFLEPFRTTITRATTPLQRQAVVWCVQNFVALSQSGSNGWPIFCYEEFVSNRDETFGRVFQSMGLKPTSVTENAMSLVVSNPTHELKTPRPWHAPLSEAEGEDVLRICEDFGLGLYGRQKMPLCAPRALVFSACFGPNQCESSTKNGISDATVNRSASIQGLR